MSSFSLISNRSSYQVGGRADGGVSNLSVALRLRPLNSREKKKGSTQVIYKVQLSLRCFAYSTTALLCAGG